MTFRSGQSGNPGGRPKGLSEVRKLARQHTAAAIERLVRVMAESESDLAAAGAANALLDRGWGKPTQIEVDIDLNLGLDRERIASDIARIFGLPPAARPAADALGGRPVVPGKARPGRKARARPA